MKQTHPPMPTPLACPPARARRAGLLCLWLLLAVGCGAKSVPNSATPAAGDTANSATAAAGDTANSATAAAGDTANSATAAAGDTANPTGPAAADVVAVVPDVAAVVPDVAAVVPDVAVADVAAVVPDVAPGPGGGAEVRPIADLPVVPGFPPEAIARAFAPKAGCVAIDESGRLVLATVETAFNNADGNIMRHLDLTDTGKGRGPAFSPARQWSLELCGFEQPCDADVRANLASPDLLERTKGRRFVACSSHLVKWDDEQEVAIGGSPPIVVSAAEDEIVVTRAGHEPIVVRTPKNLHGPRLGNVYWAPGIARVYALLIDPMGPNGLFEVTVLVPIDIRSLGSF